MAHIYRLIIIALFLFSISSKSFSYVPLTYHYVFKHNGKLFKFEDLSSACAAYIGNWVDKNSIYTYLGSRNNYGMLECLVRTTDKKTGKSSERYTNGVNYVGYCPENTTENYILKVCYCNDGYFAENNITMSYWCHLG